MKKLILIFPFLLFSCKKSEQKIDLTKKATENITSYLKAKSNNEVIIDSLKVLKLDTLTAKKELAYLIWVYTNEMDEITVKSREFYNKAYVLPEYKDSLRSSEIKSKEILNKVLKLSDQEKTIDSVEFLGYSATFYYKFTDPTSMESFSDTITYSLNPDLTIPNTENYINSLKNKYP